MGQALLQRHAAYVRQSEVCVTSYLSQQVPNLDYLHTQRTQDPFSEKHDKLQVSNDELHHELEELSKEKFQLERVSVL